MAYDQTWAFGFKPLQAVGFQGWIFSFESSQDDIVSNEEFCSGNIPLPKNSIQERLNFYYMFP